MAGMTFLQLQAAAMSDRFDEAQRGDVKSWLNSAYWQIWHAEEWPFRYATATVSVTSGSAAVTGVPADFVNARSLSRGDGTGLTALDQVDFERNYYVPRAPWSGLPTAYTVINGAISVGPTSSETASDYLLVYEKEFAFLSADTDVPAIPAGSHLAVVLKASATGLKLQNDFTWQFHEQDYQEQMDVLRRGYLRDRRDSNQSYAADWLGGY